MTDDNQLLERFATRGDEGAFRVLVDRHLNLVYSAALRLANGDAPLAEDVTQTVFIDLARKARTLSRDVVLTGWLYDAARFTTANAIRGERRRQTREQEAMAMQHSAPEFTPDWEQLGPVLDYAMGELSAPDRNAILLRYFKNQDFHSVGLALGVSDDAAQKRVSRAVDRLRESLAKRGITVGPGGLLLVISANAVQAAPVSLSAAIAAGAVGVTATAALTQATITSISLMNTKSIAALIGAALLAGTTIYFVEEQRLAQSMARQRELFEEQTRLVAATAEETRERDSNKAIQDMAELARLRNQVTQLRQQVAAQKNGNSVPSPVVPVTAPMMPGELIRMEQLDFVGYASPEAAVQSLVWAGVAGNYDVATNSLSAPMEIIAARRGINARPMDKEAFEMNTSNIADEFKSLQILARKEIRDDLVEITTITEGFDRPGMETNVYVMIKQGSDWRMADKLPHPFAHLQPAQK